MLLVGAALGADDATGAATDAEAATGAEADGPITSTVDVVVTVMLGLGAGAFLPVPFTSAFPPPSAAATVLVALDRGFGVVMTIPHAARPAQIGAVRRDQAASDRQVSVVRLDLATALAAAAATFHFCAFAVAAVWLICAIPCTSVMSWATVLELSPATFSSTGHSRWRPVR